METLRGVFPGVPTSALLRVLEICDQSVAVASTWLLENDWEELMTQEEEEQETAATEDDNVTSEVTSEVTQAPAPATTQAAAPPIYERVYYARRSSDVTATAERGGTGYYARRSAQLAAESEEDEGDEEEEEDEEDEDEMYYEEGRLRGSAQIPPLTKRVKMTDSKSGEPGNDDFWIAFDDQVMTKNMIELLNTTLSKLAHSKVVLLNRPAKDLDEGTATTKLESIMSAMEGVAAGDEAASENSPSDPTVRDVSELLNEDKPNPASLQNAKRSTSSSPTAARSNMFVGQKRKRKEEAADNSPEGFFAHFFPVSDLDMVWRSVMHAHLLKGRFGEKIEFHASSGAAKQDFDEMVHIQNSTLSSRAASLGFPPFSNLKCCLLLPCLSREEDILRIGKNLHSILKIQGSLYYGRIDHVRGDSSERRDHVDLLSEDGSITEELFRGFARYRIKKEEETPTTETTKDAKVAMDPYMGYPQPRTESYCLQTLDSDRWSTLLSSK
ncbi:hypothetical protein PHYBOEH_007326 [Phytophthora boehmeriae]|uniref:CUE domain-containing protein n=1 Tax=Phytophthora boehmeriae TaxID=109152 RepID=A0A8T1X258_9STRA|nr:hypothetical protein PHYBOEH_007326 [Phytophthora boehmeriae]